MNDIIAPEQLRSGGVIHPHEHYSLHNRLQNEVNRLFCAFQHACRFSGPETPESGSEYQTKVDVKEVGADIIVTAEIPGVRLRDLDIAATPHCLNITGEKKCEKEDKDKGYYHIERAYGYFRRVVEMPCEVQHEKADAVFKNGVLTVKLPKVRTALDDGYKVVVKAG
jgi:HSP20 family protein